MARLATEADVAKIPASAGARAVLDAYHKDGVVVIKNFMTQEQIDSLNADMQAAMDKTLVGTKMQDEGSQVFHGHNTRRLTGLVGMSPAFRDFILDNDLLHDICEDIFVKDSGAYWMNTAQVIELGPGTVDQNLHRDQWQYPIFTHSGPEAPEALVNFFMALTPFKRENGATRVIPGSHKWDDFTRPGNPDDCVINEMDPGDICFMSGKLMHGGGANKTDYWRRGLGIIFQAAYLTLEEAHPFLVTKDIVKNLSPRAQSMIGFRPQFTKDSPGLWKTDYREVDIGCHTWRD